MTRNEHDGNGEDNDKIETYIQFYLKSQEDHIIELIHKYQPYNSKSTRSLVVAALEKELIEVMVMLIQDLPEKMVKSFRDDYTKKLRSEGQAVVVFEQRILDLFNLYPPNDHQK
jgi:hypothetical protein